MKKLALLLSLLMLISVFAVACATPGDGEDTTPADAAITTPSSGDGSTPVDTTEVDIYADLPEGNFDGFQFDILTSPVGWTDYENFVIDSDIGAIGEPVNDELYNRNLLIADQFGITIEERVVTGDTEAKTIIATQALAGDKSFDMFAPSAAFGASLATEGYLVDMSELSSIDFEKPWWDVEYNESVSLGPKTYVAFGDLSLVYAGAVFCMAFNSDMLTDHGLEDPYDLYNSGNWTYDKVYEMASAVSSDEDGDGTYTTLDSDVFGLVGHSNQIIHMVLASGATIVSKDNAGVPVLNQNNEYFYNVFSNVMEKFVNVESSVWAKVFPSNYKEYDSTVTIEGYLQIFNEGRALFTTNVMAAFKAHRDAEVAYRIIEFPKYDSKQTDYISVRYSGGRGISMINGFNDDELERNATIIENMAAYNHQYVIPKFIEVTLYYKYAKDQASLDMLETILSRTGFSDLAYLYDWGSINSLTNNLIASGRTNISGAIKTIQSKLSKEIENVLEKYE